MKTIEFTIKQTVLASFFILFILGGNVNAKGTETRTASSLETTVESALQLEDWMINEKYWNTATNHFSVETEMESELKVESWMTNETNWKPESVVILENTTESTLTLDTWMLDENYWN